MHGALPPLWRPDEVSYDEFAEHLRLAGDFPTYLPWPMSPGWAVTDFGVVADARDAAAGDASPAARAPASWTGRSTCSSWPRRPASGSAPGGRPDRRRPGPRDRRRPADGPGPDRQPAGVAVVGLDERRPTATSTARCSPARPPAAGCGSCCGRRRRCCCCATTGSCATSPASARPCSRCRSAVSARSGDDRPVERAACRVTEVDARASNPVTYAGRRSRASASRLRRCASTSTPTRGPATGRRARPSWCGRRWRPGST